MNPEILPSIWYEFSQHQILMSFKDDDPSQTHPEMLDSETHIVSNIRLRSHVSNPYPIDSRDWKGALEDVTPFILYRILI